MLRKGDCAPDFTLRDTDGNYRSLDATKHPLTLAIFFKTSCPTCHYAWPFYERLHRAYADAGLAVLGISQHDVQLTRAYRDQYRATFPHLVDDDWRVSRAYDPEFVPSGFLIDAQGVIVETFASWESERLNRLAQEIAARLGAAPQTIVTAQDNALPFKAG